jgi:hypothetical protein
LHWQPYCIAPLLPQKFIIVLQDPWQRDMLVEYGHGKMVHYDGTFSTNENMYTLNVLVVTDVEGHGIPVSYAICEGKDAESHVKVIEEIIDNCKKTKPDFAIATVMLDCEKAEKNGWQKAFEGKVNIAWCEFHFKQAIIKNVGQKAAPCLSSTLTEPLFKILHCTVPTELHNDPAKNEKTRARFVGYVHRNLQATQPGICELHQGRMV